MYLDNRKNPVISRFQDFKAMGQRSR